MAINIRNAKRWAANTAKRDRLHIIREGSHVTITDERAVIRMMSGPAWEIIRHLPVPIPDEDGSYCIHQGTLTQGSDRLATIIREHADRLTAPATDTRLIHVSDVHSGQTARIILVNGQYTLINTTLFDLFEPGLELRGLDNRHAIAFYQNDLVGMVLPIIADYISPYLVPAASLADTAAD